MLCATCYSVFRADASEITTTIRGTHHLSIENLKVAAENGCYLCSDLLDEHEDNLQDSVSSSTCTDAEFLVFEIRISLASKRVGEVSFHFPRDDISSATYELVYTKDLEKPEGYDRFLEQVTSDLQHEPSKVRSDSFLSSSRSVSDSTGDLETLETAKDWLNRCVDTHTKCGKSHPSRPTQWYPKRLIDLSSPDSIRLIETQSEPPNVGYATLSHCWGPHPICTLTTSNIDEYKVSIPSSILSNTFRDAVSAASMLRMRYIWIDSLCIIQAGDDGKDWLEHASAMRLVYTNSAINIAAADAEQGADGIFNDREGAALRPCHVIWEWPTRFYEYDGGQFWTIRRRLQHSSMALRMLPLYTRGWVVQERFLSPRVLHFAEDRLFWECKEVPLADESFLSGFQESCPEWEAVMQWPFSIDQPGQIQPDSDDPLHALWQDMLTDYTNCALSFPEKDNLIALAGIAERFGQSYNHAYIAGLFRQHLPYDLLWQNKGKPAVKYRAPSWSWASIDGQVEMRAFSECPFCERCCVRSADVLDVKVGLIDDGNVYGLLRHAALVLSTRLLECSVQPAKRAGTGLRQKMRIWADEDRAVCVDAEAEVDKEADSLRGFTEESGKIAWAMPLIELRTGTGVEFMHRGLLVERTDDGAFKRVGIYRIKNRVMDRDPFREVKVQEVRLV